MKCRHCKAELKLPLIDLGSAPPSNAYLTKEALNTPEKWFPLRVLVCEYCWLVQTEDFAQADELFDEEYAYFSSFSTSWLQHAKRYVKDMIKRFFFSYDSSSNSGSTNTLFKLFHCNLYFFWTISYKMLALFHICATLRNILQEGFFPRLCSAIVLIKITSLSPMEFGFQMRLSINAM